MAVRGKKIWWVVLAAAVLALISVADGRGFRRFLRFRQEAADLQARNQTLREQNQRYRAEIEALRGDRAALERAVREELGFIRPGEIVLNLE
ncbi:MAG TPA: septum formation initiator family protein [Myxococcaceae bacterium]|jgi:cell division protein FtsB|nr:septum formation initiator family protein [Myxococcaceae bacterium]